MNEFEKMILKNIENKAKETINDFIFYKIKKEIYNAFDYLSENGNLNKNSLPRFTDMVVQNVRGELNERK